MHVSLCVCAAMSGEEIHHRCSHSSFPNMLVCCSVCADTLRLSVLRSSGAAGARLLTGQNKPDAMDVDEEENMSESILMFLIGPSIFSYLYFCSLLSVCLLFLSFSFCMLRNQCQVLLFTHYCRKKKSIMCLRTKMK